MEITNFISSLLSHAWSALNSTFAIAFIGGLTGAFGGALGAQHIAERSKRREEMLKELRNTNAAIMVAFSICNGALALKKQHVQPMYEQFGRDRDAIRAFAEQRAAGQRQGGAEFRFVADMRTFPAPVVPIATLEQLMFEKISTYGRPLALVSVLNQSLVGLRDAIGRRDLFIHRMASGDISAEQVPQYYFGMPLPTGDINQEYPDLVDAIHSYVDDVGYFSALLCSDLVKHGKSVRDSFAKKFGKGAPEVSAADFSGPRQTGLLPSDDQYADWLRGYKEEVSKPQSRSRGFGVLGKLWRGRHDA